ncbi:bifunctional glutamate--cysteine ligase GshA/glutathione synthetase GshB [Ancylomarina euxinus]|uniref:Glutamate--cysteine ligase n=1 Tax=Ancylomarina euxinus TaxID=2283627 RepID=A0A425Y4X1_9BACT|nr:bifunctional glutamate--cysteine ligase GshA/glutathione synthetase GshB [Ancylomarina euxinus]MCZ4694696.1 bifunctional glutamate--cysteine ligase GshA/glutathione synthetase GshB [Ancylomarina euxinus]MUP14240.1 bifunctional glutamate--cysteine ligase GshA/glutathione synthetase GshB [Ancylomarina euxinus]RRG23088.1 bifunctional glutamate--cysteine ligase GshA/glutathione synthetase GshB [Ancylomarina euxinus]
MKTIHKNLFEVLEHKSIRSSICDGKFGIEKENVRVDKDGRMATTPHPGILGDKFQHPYITTDFSESQVEMITPPLDSVDKVHGFLETLHDVVTQNIGEELLWPQSLPPLLPDEENIPIAQFGDKGLSKERYREVLAKRYGRERQMLTGIHYNFSLSDRLEKKLIRICCPDGDAETFRETLYLKMLRNFMRYRWFLVWLFGSSPVSDPSFKMKSLKTGEKKPVVCGHAVSIRTSSGGYSNEEEYFVDFNSLDAFSKSISKLVDEGRLIGHEELYLPIRLKFDDNERISHVEVRLLDLDPYEKAGISKDRLNLVHLFLLHCLFKDEPDHYDERQQEIAANNQDLVACYGLKPDLKLSKFEGEDILASDYAKEIYSEIKNFLNVAQLEDNERYISAMKHCEDLMNGTVVRASLKIREDILKEGFISFHMKQAKKYQLESKLSSFRFHGFENLELSTQLLLKAALRRGVEFEILDQNENFVRLKQGDKVEYVMQATRTSLDNYSSVLMMENKLVTKTILDEFGISVPGGMNYLFKEKALSDFELFEGRAIVIKPKSTNFGLGISILKENNKEEVYQRAVEIAFEHDNSILIEDFVPGREFRFFVMGEKVVGILHRVPANVKGDGKSSIRELVLEKNLDPLRGKGYVTPLEKINLGEAEAMFLADQNLTFDSIPNTDEIIYLRENSNISTGGDSIDFTDDIHQSYKDIAIKATKALDVEITGLDMMIIDVTTPATEQNYSIIEMNFNPAIHIHCYPYKGENRYLNEKVLDALGY